jgi:hypothetical protein
MEGGQVIVSLPKCVLAMSRERSIECLRQGKRWHRQQAMQARVARLPQEPRSVSGEGGRVGRRR